MPKLKKITLLLSSPVLLSAYGLARAVTASRRKAALSVVAVGFATTACGPEPVVIANAELCRSWRHQTVSKDDQLTNQTAAIAEGNNNARTRWKCVWGKNQAKS